MRYVFPCSVEVDPETGRFVLECSSPSAVAEGETLEAAKEEMLDLLLLNLGDCIRFHEKFPAPAEATAEATESVSFTHLQTLKVALINAMVDKNLRPIDLARKLNVPRQEVSRILSPRVPTKFETIAESLEAIGLKLEISVIPIG